MTENYKNYILRFIAFLFLLFPAVEASANDLSNLSHDDAANIQMACVLERSKGPVAYNSCVANQLKLLGNGKAADLSNLSHDDAANIQLACVSERSNGPVAYNKCVHKHLASLETGVPPTE